MNTAENRIEYVSNRLHSHWLNDVGIPVLLVASNEWNLNVEDFGPTAACGWAWPLITEDDSRVVAICPALIASTTDHLSQEHLDDYLGIIQYTVDRHIVLMVADPDQDPWERHKEILDGMQETYPLALELLQEIQARANS